jgi:hypothetical protein
LWWDVTEVTAAITKLNNKKSGDEFGISAEHFKLAGQSIVAALVELFNAILEHGKKYRRSFGETKL